MSSQYNAVTMWDETEIETLLRVEPDGTDCFVARSNQMNTNQTVFGGQVLGQSLAAASATVQDRSLHSMHGYFLRPGIGSEPVRYRVERTREGRSFTTRRVTGTQGAETIFHMECSYHADEPGWDHQLAMPEVPAPEQLEDLAGISARIDAGIAKSLLSRLSATIEVKPIEPERLLSRQEDSRLRLWFRVPSAAGITDPALNQQILAWMSDHWLSSAAVVRHQVILPNPDMMIASLDHAMWFHRPCQTGAWMLFDFDSPSAFNGTGLSRGLIYDRAGLLVATVVQESLQRPRRKPRVAK
jgi:acyl-CoA thioesterase-2